jgi:hypothetical protein
MRPCENDNETVMNLWLPLEDNFFITEHCITLKLTKDFALCSLKVTVFDCTGKVECNRLTVVLFDDTH